MSTIKDIRAIEIVDSRGTPTVKAYVTLDDGSMGYASVPSGASTGSHEAVELRDNDSKRYFGKGVRQAVENVNTTVKTALVGKDADPRKIDELLLSTDGTENKAKLGANATLAVSEALIRALAFSQKKPLWNYINSYYFSGQEPSFPRLMVNVVNGGKHAGWNFDIQEFMVVPTSNIPSQSVRVAAELFHELGVCLKKEKLSTLVGDEGGYSPVLSSNDAVFQTIIDAGKLIGHEVGSSFSFAIDAAATEWHHDGLYFMKKTNSAVSVPDLIKTYLSYQEKYGVISFEDPFAEDDWEAFTALTQELGNKAIVVGDDLFVTNVKRLEKGINTHAASAILIKPNQIGTIKETIEAIETARAAQYKVIISHRSGETEDSFIADLAYASGADFIKTGSMSRSERLAKYNRLLEIEQSEL